MLDYSDEAIALRLHGIYPWSDEFDLYDARKIPGEAQRQKQALLAYRSMLSDHYNSALWELSRCVSECDSLQDMREVEIMFNLDIKIFHDWQASIDKLDRIIRRQTLTTTQ